MMKKMMFVTAMAAMFINVQAADSKVQVSTTTNGIVFWIYPHTLEIGGGQAQVWTQSGKPEDTAISRDLFRINPKDCDKGFGEVEILPNGKKFNQIGKITYTSGTTPWIKGGSTVADEMATVVCTLLRHK